jgi:hypothetical protein
MVQERQHLVPGERVRLRPACECVVRRQDNLQTPAEAWWSIWAERTKPGLYIRGTCVSLLMTPSARAGLLRQGVWLQCLQGRDSSSKQVKPAHVAMLRVCGILCGAEHRSA